MNQPTSRSSVSGRQHERTLQEVGGSAYVLRLILGLSVVGAFYLVLLGSMLLSAFHIVSQQNTLNYFTSYTALLGDLMNMVVVMIVILAAALLIRLIPLICCIIIYRRSRSGAPMSSLLPVFTWCQVFGVTETLLWSALAVYDIVNLFRYGFVFPRNAGSVYYMILVVSVVMLVCKIVQGIQLTKFMARLKYSVRSEQGDLSYYGGLRFSSVMLTVCHVILLVALVANLLIVLGFMDFLKTFQYLWMWYLFLIGYIMSNSFLSAVLGSYHRKMSLAGVSGAAGYGTYGTGTGSSASGGVYNPYQTYHSPEESNAPYSPPPQTYGQTSNQPFGNGYGQPPQNQAPTAQQPFGTGYGQIPQNQAPTAQQPFGTGYGQTPSSYGQQPQNPTPPVQQSFGTGYGQSTPPNTPPPAPPANDPFGDMFTFNTHNRR